MNSGLDYRPESTTGLTFNPKFSFGGGGGGGGGLRREEASLE